MRLRLSSAVEFSGAWTVGVPRIDHAKIVAAAILTAVALAVLSVLFCWVPSAP
jgi:hypothetical protein